MHFLDNLKSITREGSTETWQTNPFLSTSSALTISNIHFYIWKWSKFIFLWSSLWSILVCKMPQFWAKAQIHIIHMLLKSISSFVPQEDPKKCISLWTIPVYSGVYIRYSKSIPPVFALISFPKIISTLRSGSTK